MRKIKGRNGGTLNVLEKGETANPNGRPPLTLTNVLKDLRNAGYERVTVFMVLEAYEILLGLDEHQLHEIINDKKQVMSMRIVAKAMMSRKGSEMLEKMLDRAHGKPKQTQELVTPELLNIRVSYESRPNTSDLPETSPRE